MSALPKKKLCWNCEGNVSREIDNCPYCGVYLQGTDFEESLWNPPYSPSSNPEEQQEIPEPLYQIHPTESPPPETEKESVSSTSSPSPITYLPGALIGQLKKDIFPTLFLMVGSAFFLFSMLLFLFSYEGKLILQWNGKYWLYFFLLSLPSLGYGWKCLQNVD